ncbi:MAG TPA: serine/threonine-protein kinase [Polyangiaceae bacterium]
MAAPPDSFRDSASRPIESASPSSVRLGSVPESPAQELRLVQDRVALLGKVTFFISSMFLLATIAADLARGLERVQPLGRAGHAVGTLIALLMWQVLRRKRQVDEWTLTLSDVLGTLGICVSFVVMGRFAVQPYGYYTAMLAVTHVSISRAMMVPSLPRRTLLLGIASFAGFVVMRATLPLSADMLQMGGRVRGIIEPLLWSTAGVAVCTVASTVIYGLHARARQALQLGQYTLEEKIGQGGMGEIYRARHAMLRRPTAIKLLLGGRSEQQLRRFEKEVQLTARLTHPNTISIYDYGRTPDGVFYYAMELLEGMTLEQLVERHGPLPAGRAIHFLRQVCGALNEAHRSGLIHRDIKPANIFVCRRGAIADFIKVLDFGLVREVQNEPSVDLSSVNVVVGTPLYMAPEAIVEPNSVDAATDIYALGAVAYFLLTGEPPFTGSTVIEVCMRHMHSIPPPPSESVPVPPELDALILSCLAKEKADRPAGVAALAQALDACADAHSWSPTEAEAWWSTRASTRPPSVAEPESNPTTRRTLVAADLEQRLRVGKRTA